MNNSTLFADLYGLHRAVFTNPDSHPSERGKAVLETRNLLRANSDNRLLSLVLNNANTTLFEEAEKLRRNKFRSYRKYLPHRHDECHNLDVEELGRIAPNAEHLKTHSLLELDNAFTALGYGIVGSPVIIGMAEVPKDRMLEAAAWCCGLFTTMGLIGNICMRNRKIGNRGDIENARLWDTLQYVDMVINFDRKNNGSLALMDKQNYLAPRYPSLNEKQRRMAYDNLFTNPFIRGIGVNVSAGYKHESDLRPRTIPSQLA